MIQLPWKQYECLYHEDWRMFLHADGQPDADGYVTVFYSVFSQVDSIRQRVHINKLIQNATY